MTKAPSTAARLIVALCSRAVAAIDAARANDGVAARIRRTLKRSVEKRIREVENEIRAHFELMVKGFNSATSEYDSVNAILMSCFH